MRTLLEFAGDFLRRYGQMVMNMVVFFGIFHWMLVYTFPSFLAHQFDFVDTMFLLHNIVMITLILARFKHRGVDRNFFHQAIAVIAFFSGLAFTGTATSNPLLLITSKTVICIAMILGTITLFNLGRSFGILIAYRKVKISYLYSIVRHPMYLTDIFWKIGIILYKPSWFNLAIFAVSASCYVYRAILEEEFLSQQPEYREYMARVRYRFLPGIF
ncbi:MAG: isoprenylcysteine carboxylmethyltransferase family protein [Victivallales bacterium]